MSLSFEPFKISPDNFRRASFGSFKNKLVKNQHEPITGIHNPAFVTCELNFKPDAFEYSKNNRKLDTNEMNIIDSNYLSPLDKIDPSLNSSINLIRKISEKSEYHALKQMLIPFLIAGHGNVATGLLLAYLQTWKVFENIPQLYILIPALLGLKGNVEMTLASRLSTHLNLGNMDEAKKRQQIMIGNMSLVQCQASSIGFVASLIAIIISFLFTDDITYYLKFESILILITSSILTANIANILLGSLMIVVIIASKKFKINPDNIATPIAASFGDLTTLFILAYSSHFLYLNLTYSWIFYSIIFILLAFIPVWAFIANSIQFTRKILISGWFPIFGAMILQILGGVIMEHSLSQFVRLATFQPIINGT